ncbi:hypothetical protein QYE76_013311 [Lolium multiflorum]|uniref:Uncharacterized protein n=1 Tax=Lolium multiflorum TaxID=4521 RepID=A0AAD8U3P3_LOLMU|nr:hypothetical protein QYE76_013311 [Lolium multiflorum]
MSRGAASAAPSGATSKLCRFPLLVPLSGCKIQKCRTVDTTPAPTGAGKFAVFGRTSRSPSLRLSCASSLPAERKTSTTMHPLLNIPLSGGCAFPPVAAALRLPAASLPCRSAGSTTRRRRPSLTRAGSDGSDGATAGAVTEGEGTEPSAEKPPPVVNPKIEKELKKVGTCSGVGLGPRFHGEIPPALTDTVGVLLEQAVQKTAATFAPRASTASKNPAVPGSTLYTIFEVQAYASMLAGGALSFNLVFPSSEPDIWRLIGMWSIWMFTIPSLRARDCSNKEKEALNYLFILVPLINVIIPFFVKSFAIVWSADTVAFFVMYAWKEIGSSECTYCDKMQQVQQLENTCMVPVKYETWCAYISMKEKSNPDISVYIWLCCQVSECLLPM